MQGDFKKNEEHLQPFDVLRNVVAPRIQFESWSSNDFVNKVHIVDSCWSHSSFKEERAHIFIHFFFFYKIKNGPIQTIFVN